MTQQDHVSKEGDQLQRVVAFQSNKLFHNNMNKLRRNRDEQKMNLRESFDKQRDLLRQKY